MQNSTPSEIKKTRIDAGLTQKAAAALICKSRNAWAHWEIGDRSMNAAFLSCLKLKLIGSMSHLIFKLLAR